MKDTELKKQRDRALYDVYKAAIQEHDFATVRQAADFVRQCQAPKFYISSRTLSQLFGYITRGLRLPKMHPTSTRRLNELYRRYLLFVKENPACRLSRERICELLLDEPAPEFYIEVNMAMKIIAKERAEALARLARRYHR